MDPNKIKLPLDKTLSCIISAIKSEFRLAVTIALTLVSLTVICYITSLVPIIAPNSFIFDHVLRFLIAISIIALYRLGISFACEFYEDEIRDDIFRFRSKYKESALSHKKEILDKAEENMLK